MTTTDERIAVTFERLKKAAKDEVKGLSTYENGIITLSKGRMVDEYIIWMNEDLVRLNLIP